MLEKIKLLNDFFERYGVCITSQDTSKTTFGIIKRVTNLNAEYDDRTLTRSGFMKKCEYLIISKADIWITNYQTAICFAAQTAAFRLFRA